MSLGVVLNIAGVLFMLGGCYEWVVSLLLCAVIDNIRVQIRSLLCVLAFGVGVGLLIAGIVCNIIN